jgi:hypothetical protein
MAAGIEHRDGQRETVAVAAFIERAIDDGRSLSKSDD